ncbi:MerR family transcriptional regulator [Sanguibacter sp. 25GB23B1]|uniref:MerR family transcriptional regulator n=1 Tax=unclassified Sanguibacter TaxID=2645534 RepID=UPI0032AFDDE8
MTNVRPLDDPPHGAESGSTSPGLAVAAVARRLGVAPATLRTWDRRYGLGPSGHSAGAHRRYSDDDVARLMVMRRLALDGVAPVDAARSALALDLSSTTRERVEAELRESIAQADSEASGHGGHDTPDHDDTAARGPTSAGTVAAVGTVAPLHPTRSDVTARSDRPALRLAAPVATPEITSSDIVDAVLRGNLSTCVRLLALEADQDPAEWWTTLVEPTVRRLSARTVLAKPGEAPEVLLASATLTVLGTFIREREERAAAESGGSASHPSRMRKIVLLFSAVDDPQPLAMHALGAALVAQGVTARVVTGPANAHRAMELVTMVRPVATVLVTSLTRPELGIVHALHDAQPDLPIFVGLSSDDAAADLPLAANVSRVRSFHGLLHEVLAIAR